MSIPNQAQQLCEKHSIMYSGVCPICVDKLDANPPRLPLTLYAQKTPSGDVRLFHKDGSIAAGAWSPYQSGCPTARSKMVTLNCYRWRLVWLPGVCPADQYSESENAKILRQYGGGPKGKGRTSSRPRTARPRLSR